MQPRIARHEGAYRLTTKLHLKRPVEQVFAFFADAANLEAITPPIVDRPAEGLRAGARIDYRLRLHGLPVRWQSEITLWDPPHRFVDEQRRGPYRLWVHEHTFEARDGGTRVRDSVRYAVPGGAVVHALLVRRDLRRIFEYRTAALLERFA